MKFALRNGEKIEAKKGVNDAICPICKALVIPKCGEVKIHHWAHKKKIECDHWWENETEWHRDWKNHFPADWQEIVHTSDDNEKHIADIKTPSGLVVEFQHSPIETEEIMSRNNFYKNIVWVVDGKRRKNDERFFNSENSRLIKQWGNIGKFVFIDFGKPLLRFLKPLVDGRLKIGHIKKDELIKLIYNYTDINQPQQQISQEELKRIHQDRVINQRISNLRRLRRRRRWS